MSIVVYKTSHRIPIKIGDAIIKVSPLNEGQRLEIQDGSIKEDGTLKEDIFVKGKKLFKYSIKEIEGFDLPNGEKYELSFEDEKKEALTDECVNDFFNMKIKAKVAEILWSFFNEFCDKPKNAATGKIITGIEILPAEGVEEVKK